MAPRKPNRIFISYSHDDKAWVERLHKMLAPVMRDQTISVWWDKDIKPSQKWRGEIDEAMKEAGIAVLMVSANFLASEFINAEELPYLLEAAEKENVSLLWIPVSASLYTHTPIADYQAVHDPKRPLDGLSAPERNAALVAISQEIIAAANAPRVPKASPKPEEPVPEPLREPAPAAPASTPAAPERPTAEPSRPAARFLAGLEDFDDLNDAGRDFADRGELPEALLAFESLVERAGLRRPDWAAQGYESLGDLYDRQGDGERAREHWEFARHLYRQIGLDAKADELAGKLGSG